MWSVIPFGAIPSVLMVALTLSPARRPRSLAVTSWAVGQVPNELPVLFLAVLVSSTVPGLVDGGLGTPEGAVSASVTAATAVGFIVIARRAVRAAPVVGAALDDSIGPTETDRAPTSERSHRRLLRQLRLALAPWPVQPSDVVRESNIGYGPHGKQNRLDVYRHRSHPTNAPTLIHLHGGGFRRGRKSWESRPLLHHMARRGWTCISADYRLTRSPGEGFPGHLVDVKRVIAWARTEGRAHGVDPNVVVVSGSSAGAHLAMMAALTADDPEFQPGFESADTSITAGIGLYGYYGSLGNDDGPSSDPVDHVGPHAPPLFVIHGDNDTYTPVEGARRLVDNLRATAARPVAYAELPGAQHSFDLFHSIRFHAAVTAIDRFASWAAVQQRMNRPSRV